MEYGLIGEHLGHSFSKEIHEKLSGRPYELREIAREDLAAFLERREFLGINVTIPYKEAVIPHLDVLSDEARAIGAVNTIVNRDGRLYGYNTDYSGFLALADQAGVRFEGRKVLILGAGGAAKCVAAAARDRGAASVEHAVRSPRTPEQRSLQDLQAGGPYEVIVNCTPVGMFPHDEGRIVDLTAFPNLQGVLDLIYNPLRTNLILDAEALGVPASGGLYMLVAQAVKARDYFGTVENVVNAHEITSTSMRASARTAEAGTEPALLAMSVGREPRGVLGGRAPSAVEASLPIGAPAALAQTFSALLKAKRNIVLIGMPSCGKTTLARALAKRSGRRYLDTDALITERAGKPIPEIFAEQGEAAFRALESKVIEGLSASTGLVLSTGGGAILDPENVRRLRRNGLLCCIRRDPSLLRATPDRPLSRSPEALRALYEQRKEAYAAATDLTIDNNGPLEATLKAFEDLL